MVLSVSAVILLGVIAFLMFRKDEMKPSHAIVCALFGFYLSSTAVAPSIKAGTDQLTMLLSGISM
jgi:hypothetical protein